MSYDIRIERLLDTTPEKAFDAWADPAARLRWYSPAEGMHIEASGEARVGGAWSVAFGESADQLYREEGVYSEVDRPRRLAYNQIFSTPGGVRFETFVTVTFEERNGKTLLTLVDAGLPDEETRKAHENGWPAFIDRYEQLLATA